jgi:hypothetical protein
MTLEELTDGIRHAFPSASVTIEPPLKDGEPHQVDVRLGHDLVSVELHRDGHATVDDLSSREVDRVLSFVGRRLALALLDHRGEWAAVTLNEASAGRGWYMHRIVGVTRWATRERALERRVRKWSAAGRRAAVIPWGDDLVTGASPELARVPRVIQALALDKHEPLFACDEPGALPNGLTPGCSCGFAFDPPLAWNDATPRYAAHVAAVLPALEARGYDLTTLRLQIRKKAT